MATVLKLLPLLAIGFMSFFVFEAKSFQPFNISGEPLSVSIAATAALTLWAFLGLESATIPADNVENPRTTIPKATMIGVVITAIVYVSSQITIISVVPNAVLQTSGAPFADAATTMWGETAGFVVAIVAVISCLGALNGWILLQGQVPMSAARDKLMPAFMSDKNNDGVSVGALVLSSVIISFLVMANFSEGLVSLYTFAILVSTLGIFIPYLLSIAVDIRIILQDWTNKRDYFAILSGVFAMLYCVWAISGIGSQAMLWGLALIASGLPVYWYMKKQQTN